MRIDRFQLATCQSSWLRALGLLQSDGNRIAFLCILKKGFGLLAVGKRKKAEEAEEEVEAEEEEEVEAEEEEEEVEAEKEKKVLRINIQT